MMKNQLSNDEIMNKPQCPNLGIGNWKIISSFWFGNLGFIIFCLLLSACAPAPTKPALTPAEPESTIETTKESQPVFTYGQEAGELFLELKAEPCLIGDSLVRLVGVVAGRTAVVEVVGRGRSLKLGDEILGYIATEIGFDYVRLGKE